MSRISQSELERRIGLEDCSNSRFVSVSAGCEEEKEGRVPAGFLGLLIWKVRARDHIKLKMSLMFPSTISTRLSVIH